MDREAIMHYPAIISPAIREKIRSMSIDISQETEARLADDARRQGISVDALLEQFINERAAVTRTVQMKPELPVWHLGSVGSLHRRDIYDDAR
jgi:hypothetical protein